MSNNIKIKFISYSCYLLAILFFLKIFWSVSILEKIISVVFALIWYQAATGLLKRRNLARKFVISLMSFFLIGLLIVIYDSIIMPLIDPSINYVGIGRWISLVLIVIPSFSIWVLLNKSLKNEFIQNQPNQALNQDGS